MRVGVLCSLLRCAERTSKSRAVSSPSETRAASAAQLSSIAPCLQRQPTFYGHRSNHSRYRLMKKSVPSKSTKSDLPVSKQTAGGVAGAIIGSVVAGPVGAIAGAVAGTMMGNRAARGKTLVSAGTKESAKSAVETVKKSVPALRRKAAGKKPTAASSKGKASARPTAAAKTKGATKSKAAAKSQPKKPAKKAAQGSSSGAKTSSARGTAKRK